MSMKTAKLVEKILKENRTGTIIQRSPRDSDKALIVQYLQYSGANLTEAQINVIRGVSFETVTRVRRKFQEGGEYLGDKKIAAERKAKAEKMRTGSLSAQRPEDIEDLLDD